MSKSHRAVPSGAWCCLCTLSFLTGAAHGQDALPVRVPDRQSPVDFDAEIMPILKSNCLACHSASEAEGDLVLESPASIAQGGLSGPAIIAGSSTESLLFQAAAHLGDVIMPPEGNAAGATNLTPEELGLLKLWIDQGAPVSAAAAGPMLDWRALPADLDPIYAVAITSHGRYAATGWGSRLFVYQIATQRLVGELVDPSLASSRERSREGSLVSTGGGATAHRDLVQSLDFSPNGERLASGGFRTVKVWRRVPPVVLHRPREAEPTRDIDKSAGDQRVQWQANLVQVKNAGSGDGVRSFDLERAVSFAALAPDGSRVVALGPGGPGRLWDVASGSVIAELHGDVALREQVADAERMQRVRERQREWAQRDLDAARKRKQEAEDTVAQAKKELESAEAALAEKQKIEQEKVTAGEAAELEAAKAEREMAERDIASAQDAVRLNEPIVERAVEDVRAAEAAVEETQRAIEAAVAETDRLQKELTAAGVDFVTAAFSPDSMEIAAVDSCGTLQTFAAGDGSPLEQVETGATDPLAVSFVDRHRVQMIAGDVVWEAGTLPSWELERTIGNWDDPQVLVDRVTALDFSPDGKLLAAGSGEPSRTGQIKLFAAETGSTVAAIEDAHSDSVLSLAFSPDGGRLASGGADRFAKVFTAADGTLERMLEGHTGHVAAVAWHADGRTLATAGADTTVKVWDTRLGEQQTTIDGFNAPLTDLAFLGTDDVFVVTGGKNIVTSRKTDGSGGTAYGGAANFVHAVSAASDGSRIVAGGEDGVLRVWRKDGTAVAVLAPE